MNIKNDYYFDFRDMFKDYRLEIFIGGRANRLSKINYSICTYLEYLFGGEVEYDYDVARQTHKYKLQNDDIGYFEFSVVNEAIIYEPLEVRIVRMCEEYDGYMRYKFRDYKE